MIVPEVAGGAAAELADLRAACDAALSRLAAAGAASLLVVGAGESDRDYSHPYRGSFAPWGVPLEVSIGTPDPGPGGGQPGPWREPESPDRRDAVAARAGERATLTATERPAAEGPATEGPGTEGLPLSLLVGAWLIRRAFRPVVPVTYRMAAVAGTTPADGCARRAARVGGDRPWALLVMGDGSACRGEKSPGYDDPRAEAYDDGVAAALGGADTEALLGLDPVLSAELGVAGRAPWQLLAGAARGAGGRWRSDLSYYAAPYGVAYFVANWELA